MTRTSVVDEPSSAAQVWSADSRSSNRDGTVVAYELLYRPRRPDAPPDR